MNASPLQNCIKNLYGICKQLLYVIATTEAFMVHNSSDFEEWLAENFIM